MNHSIGWRPVYDSITRPIFDSVVTGFKERMPREVWGIVEAHELMYQGFMIEDTSKLIEAAKMIVEIANDHHGDNAYQQGEWQILFGEFAEGKKVIEQFVEGQYRTNNAYFYLTCQWLLGRAYEGLGDNQKAIEKYEEVLKYWGDADIQIKAIRDIKERLAKLTS